MHAYIISTVQQTNDQVTVTGSVDGVAVSLSFWITPAATTAMASAISFRNFIAPLMVTALPVAPTSLSTLTATFSQ
jgi:hypothetical protein